MFNDFLNFIMQWQQKKRKKELMQIRKMNLSEKGSSE